MTGSSEYVNAETWRLRDRSKVLVGIALTLLAIGASVSWIFLNSSQAPPKPPLDSNLRICPRVSYQVMYDASVTLGPYEYSEWTPYMLFWDAGMMTYTSKTAIDGITPMDFLGSYQITFALDQAVPVDVYGDKGWIGQARGTGAISSNPSDPFRGVPSFRIGNPNSVPVTLSYHIAAGGRMYYDLRNATGRPCVIWT